MSEIWKEWKTQFVGYSRNLRLFLCFIFIWNLGLGMFGLVYNLYIKAMGYGQAMVGDVVGMTALAAAIALVPAGILNDKFGPKRLVSIGGFLVVATLTARALVQGEQGLLAAAFIGGMALALVSATVVPFIANHSTPPQRVHLFSLNLALVMLASVIGNGLGGFLSDTFQFMMGLNEVRSLQLTLLAGVGITVTGLIPVLMLAKPPETQASGKLPMRQAIRHHKASLQVIGLFVLLGLLSSTAGGMVVPYLNVYFQDRFVASKTAIGVIVSLGQGATALAYLIGPVMARRFGEAKSVIILQLCSIPFLLITAYSSNLIIASGGYLFRQALMNAANPFYNSLKMKYVDPSLRGLASSSGEAVFNLGWFLAAPVSSGLVTRYGSYYGYAYAFSITAVVYTVISILFYVFFGRDRFKPVEKENHFQKV